MDEIDIFAGIKLQTEIHNPLPSKNIFAIWMHRQETKIPYSPKENYIYVPECKAPAWSLLKHGCLCSISQDPKIISPKMVGW